MGRRSLHTPEELRRLILEAARDIVLREGRQGLSARAIAKKIDYSPGTLYNVFRNLNDLLLTIQTSLVEDAIATFHAVPSTGGAEEHVRALARCYVEFAVQNGKLWSLLFEQPTEPGIAGVNDPNVLVLDQASRVFAAALAPLMPGASEEAIEKAGRAIGYSLHGLTAIAVNERMMGSGVAKVDDHATMITDGMLALIKC